MQFIKNNYLYVIWFLFYFIIAWLLLGANWTSFFIVLVCYSISISIALSKAGEWLLRAFEGAREIETNEEREYLEPLFEEVYQNAKENSPKLNNDIKLYIIDAMYVNAFAIGKRSVAITQGAIETFSEDELKGIIGHELGHIAHGHTKALLLSVIGNMFFGVFIVLAKIVMLISKLFAYGFTETTSGFIFVEIFSTISDIMLNISIMAFMWIGQVILSINSRNNEYQADEFSSIIGYRDELISSLYLLQKIGSQKMTLKEKLTSSHPHIAKRIARLESMEN